MSTLVVLYFFSTGGYNNIRPVLGWSHWDLTNPPRIFLNHIIFSSLWGTSYKKKYRRYIKDFLRSGDNFPSMMVHALILCVFWMPLTILRRLAFSLFRKRKRYANTKPTPPYFRISILLNLLSSIHASTSIHASIHTSTTFSIYLLVGTSTKFSTYYL